MGAWGVGPFENDTAGDWMCEHEFAEMSDGEAEHVVDKALAYFITEPKKYARQPEAAIVCAALGIAAARGIKYAKFVIENAIAFVETDDAECGWNLDAVEPRRRMLRHLECALTSTSADLRNQHWAILKRISSRRRSKGVITKDHRTRRGVARSTRRVRHI